MSNEQSPTPEELQAQILQLAQSVEVLRGQMDRMLELVDKTIKIISGIIDE